jgi:phosphatidylinositol glycan class K
VKIHSHPGIGSDHFYRPLDKALITDFFGGVAQAEVFPLQEDTTPFHFTPESAAPSLPVAPSTISTAPPLMGQMHVRDSRWKEIRKWSSVFVVGCLVSWVSFVR